jgi:TolB-like protein/DNA-binding SARP family transcriptional activator/Flp pilus assembly protein TadD
MDTNDVRVASRPSVAVSLFGPFRVVRSGAESTLAPSRKVRALIAYLVMAPRPVHRARLCELLWDVTNDPRGELRWCLSKIRGLLGDPSHECVKAENDWVSIDAATIEVDALWVAARVAAATSGGDLDLLKRLAAKFDGEFLEGFEADRLPLFEAWLIGERQRFQGYHADVLSRIIALLPKDEQALPYIRQRLSLLPYDQAAHRDLMATLAACGRIGEVEAHLGAATHLFRSQGLSSAPLNNAWREQRQVAAREARPESSPPPAAPPEAVAIEVGSAVRTTEVKAIPPHLSIVVLPFANISGDPEQEYFVDGITESLTTDLSRISGSFVIARSTAFSYKGKPVDARAIGRELDVRYVLEGSVQRSGARMRVNVQLIDAESGAHLWSERFDKPLADLFDMQDEIVARLANSLNTQLVTTEARRAERAPNPDSMDLYFQGMAWINKGQALEYMSQARGFFERALALDPGNIRALVGSAHVDVDIAATYIADDRWKRLASAETVLTKALSMAPDHAWAHACMGVVQIYTNRAMQGIAECERALTLDPNFAEAHAVIGIAKFVIGRFEETESHILEAMRLSPQDKYLSAWMVIAGVAQLYLGSDDKAVTCFRRSIETSRNHPAAQYFLAGALALLGRLEQARCAVREAMAFHPDFTVSRFRAGAASDNPRYLAARERLCDGMRKAGVAQGCARLALKGRLDERRIDRTAPRALVALNPFPRRLVSALGDRLERTKADALVLSPGVKPRAPLEPAVRDPQHVDRDRPQIAAANLGGETEQRRVVAQLLSVLGGPSLDQGLGRRKRVRVVVEPDHQRGQGDDALGRPDVGAAHFEIALEPHLGEDRRQVVGPIRDRGALSRRRGEPAREQIAKARARHVLVDPGALEEIERDVERVVDVALEAHAGLEGEGEHAGARRIGMAPDLRTRRQ